MKAIITTLDSSLFRPFVGGFGVFDITGNTQKTYIHRKYTMYWHSVRNRPDYPILAFLRVSKAQTNGNFYIFSLISPSSDIVGITEPTVILTIIVQFDINHIMMLLIITITSVLNVIITSIWLDLHNCLFSICIEVNY